MTNPEKIKVMVVDDHPLMRVGVASIINARADMTVVAQTGTGEEAVALFPQHKPDVTLMDLRLPKMSGVDSIRTIRGRWPAARFVVLTTYEGDEDIHRALEAGAKGYVIKGMPYQTLIDALLRVHSGGRFLPPPVAGALLKDAPAQLRVPDPPGKKLGWAVVGLGSLSINQILPAFAKCEKSKVVALVSGHPDKANKLALRYGVSPKNIYNYQNYDSVKDNPAVDVIYIVLPNGMHAEYTVRGLEAGKHVLCEKPMANTPAECEQMIDAGRKANKKLMVAHRCRYEPHNQEAVRGARSQEPGTAKVILA